MLTIENARCWYPDTDPVHGFDHVLRVYKMATRLAQAEGADVEVVRAAALLHDAQGEIPGEENGASTRADHHLASAEFARYILGLENWEEERIAAVEHCILAHRFRDNIQQPQSLEAKVLFDADKLDAIGAIGAARAIAYAAREGQPAYYPPSDSFLETGQKESGEPHSAYHEYVLKAREIERANVHSYRAKAGGRAASLA
jgi:uncharacterized protein